MSTSEQIFVHVLMHASMSVSASMYVCMYVACVHAHAQTIFEHILRSEAERLKLALFDVANAASTNGLQYLSKDGSIN